ncbi:MAG TPA: aldo/keto reductase [Steroidobacteraceae bacterium]|nr:aldo/keto reductase [Steroidobacteraceae bacterium]
MQLRSLGQTSLKVSPLMLGGNVFGWTADEDTSFAILDAFAAAGGNFIDTANVYSVWIPGHVGGESEAVLGKWFKRSGKRKDVIVATKVGMQMAPDKKGLAAAYIESAVEESLRRLQTDYIDLYFSHTDDATVPLQETLGAYQKLIAKGKVRCIGASNYPAARLQEALQISSRESFPSYQVLQPHYNLCVRGEYEAQLELVCTERGLGVVPYFSLASGFLTGKYRSEADLSKSPRGRGAKAYLNDRGFRILAALDVVAKRLNATDAQVALAWLMARKSVTAPIASATSVTQVQELIGAMNLQLDRNAIEQLNSASAA